MNWIISLAVLTSSAIFIDCKPSESPFDLSSQPPTCTENTSWMDDCNECTCVNGHPACTQMACPPRPARNTVPCTPLTAWVEDSKVCSCSDKVKKSCDDKEFAESDSLEAVIRQEVEDQKQCDSGTTWWSKCVRCECTKYGPYCSGDIECIIGPTTTPETMPPCTPLTAWVEDSKVCTCSVKSEKSCGDNDYDGIFRGISLEYIIRRQVEKNKNDCMPNMVWSSKCFDCECTMNGPSCKGNSDCITPITNRQKRKVSIEDVIKHQLEKKKKCEEGSIWISNCANCECGQKGPKCVAIPGCIPGPISTHNINGKKREISIEGVIHHLHRKKREVTTEDVINHELKKNEKCSVGTIWISNCVNCNCGEDGPHCDAIDGCTPGPITVHKTNCEDGDDWMEDCNHCWCNKGIPACTRKLCDSHPHFPMVFPPFDDVGINGPEKLVTKREASTACKPGDTWMDDCNQCTCNKEGKASCSRMLCEKDHPEEIPWLLEQDQTQQHASKREAACKPGTVWIKMTDNDEGCAKFTCHDDGSVTSVPHFTREMCPSEPLYIEDDDDQQHQQQQHVSKREAACKPGTVWIKMTDNDEGCAKFTCHDDGSVTSVPHFTREMCPSEPQYIEDDEEQQQQHVSKREAACKPGTKWIQMTDAEGCAEFACHDDGSVTSKPHFSREMCPSEPHYIEDDGQQQQHVSKREAACKPGDTWMDDCNQCTCNNEGKASCSRKLCEKDHPEEIPWLLEQSQQ